MVDELCENRHYPMGSSTGGAVNEGRKAGLGMMAAAAAITVLLAVAIDDIFWVPAAVFLVATITAWLLIRRPATHDTAPPEAAQGVSMSEVLVLGLIGAPAVFFAVLAATGNEDAAWLSALGAEGAALGVILLVRKRRHDGQSRESVHSE